MAERVAKTLVGDWTDPKVDGNPDPCAIYGNRGRQGALQGVLNRRFDP